MAVYDVGDRRHYDLADGEGLDDRGYALTSADGQTVQKATADDTFVGVSFRSTQDEVDREVLTGGNSYQGEGDSRGASVEQEAMVVIQCEAGEYGIGDPVYLTAEPGVCSNDAVAYDANTQVGTVGLHKNISEQDLVPVNITGYV